MLLSKNLVLLFPEAISYTADDILGCVATRSHPRYVIRILLNTTYVRGHADLTFYFGLSFTISSSYCVCFPFLCFIFSPVIFIFGLCSTSRVIGACPVTTDCCVILWRRANVRTLKTTTATPTTTPTTTTKTTTTAKPTPTPATPTTALDG